MALSASARPRRSRRAWLTLALVAVTIVSSGFVFSEPTPVDALTIGLIVILPAVGLVAFNPMLITPLLAVDGRRRVGRPGGTLSLDLSLTLTQVGVTLYLTLTSVVFAGFIAKNSCAHSRAHLQRMDVGRGCRRRRRTHRLLRSAPPAPTDLFTKFGRASGRLQGPHVFGPFLVTPLIYMVHVALGRPWHRMLAPLAIAGALTLTVLLTFSRGAWMTLTVAPAISATSPC